MLESVGVKVVEPPVDPSYFITVLNLYTLYSRKSFLFEYGMLLRKAQFYTVTITVSLPFQNPEGVLFDNGLF